MTRRIRTSEDLVQAVIDLRRAGELLAHSCDCSDRPGKPHMLGDHLWQSTKDMRPGIRASSAELRASANGDSETADPTEPRDPHDEFVAAVSDGQRAALDIIGFVQRYRPDRTLETVPATPSDDEWCRACLAAGYCIPRWRNESLCRWCSEYVASWRIEPPKDIIVLRETGQNRKITVGQIQASNKAERKRLNTEKRKAKAKAS